VGDIDGDGMIEVVVGTMAGRIHALKGTDGSEVSGFPFQAGGRIMAPILLTQLHEPSVPTGMHLVTMAFDGYLYVIDAASGEAKAVNNAAVILSTESQEHCDPLCLMAVIVTFEGSEMVG